MEVDDETALAANPGVSLAANGYELVRQRSRCSEPVAQANLTSCCWLRPRPRSERALRRWQTAKSWVPATWHASTGSDTDPASLSPSFAHARLGLG